MSNAEKEARALGKANPTIQILKDYWWGITVISTIILALTGGYVHLISTYARIDQLEQDKTDLTNQIQDTQKELEIKQCQLHYQVQKAEATAKREESDKRADEIALLLPADTNTTPNAERERKTLKREMINADTESCQWSGRFTCLNDDKLLRCKDFSEIDYDACPLHSFQNGCAKDD